MSNHHAGALRRPTRRMTDDTRVAAQRHRIGGEALSLTYFAALALLVAVATSYGLMVDDAYRLVSDMTRETWRAQDAVTLSLVPLSLVSSRRPAPGH